MAPRRKSALNGTVEKRKARNEPLCATLSAFLYFSAVQLISRVSLSLWTVSSDEIYSRGLMRDSSAFFSYFYILHLFSLRLLTYSSRIMSRSLKQIKFEGLI